MKIKLINILSVCVGFIAGNFIFQYFQEIPDYISASNRSFFQVWALMTTYLISKITGGE